MILLKTVSGLLLSRVKNLHSRVIFITFSHDIPFVVVVVNTVIKIEAFRLFYFPNWHEVVSGEI